MPPFIASIAFPRAAPQGEKSPRLATTRSTESTLRALDSFRSTATAVKTSSMCRFSPTIARLTLLTFVSVTLRTDVAIGALNVNRTHVASATATEVQASSQQPAPKAVPVTPVPQQATSSCPKFLVVDAVELAT